MNNSCGHSIVKCRACGKVISQCRCMSEHKSVVWSLCDACKAGRAPEQEVVRNA